MAKITLKTILEELKTLDAKVDTALKRRDATADSRFEFIKEKFHENGLRFESLEGQIREVRSEMKAGFSAVRNEMKTEFSAVRNEMKTEFSVVRKEMKS